MPVVPQLQRELVRLRRRAFAATFVQVFARATATGVALAAVAVLGLHLFDSALLPAPSWALGLALPLGLAAVAAARRTPPARAFAVDLDRRLGAAGLLLSALERDPGAWSAELEDHLRAAAGTAPPVGATGPLLRAMLAAAALAALALLPPPEPRAGGLATAALESALDEVQADLELAAEAGLLTEGEADAMQDRAEDLERRLLAGDPVAWADIDALAERLARSGESAAAGTQAVAAGAKSLAEDLEARIAGRRDLAELGRLAERAAELGLLTDLPQEVRAALEQLARRGGTGEAEAAGAEGGPGLDPGALDAGRLRALAEALEHQAGRRMQGARRAAEGGAPGADALRRMLEEQGLLGPGSGASPGEAGVAGGPDGFDPTPGPDGDGGPGRGGISRGRGDAALEFDGATGADLAGMRAERLPPGRTPPDRWDLAGVRRAEPESDPDRDPAAGASPAAAGSAGEVTFRRDLAPRHREAVRRFFGGGGR